MSALPQTLGEMRRVIIMARAAAIQASKQRAGLPFAEREDIDAGDELAIEMATECGFLSPEGSRTWLGRRAVLYPDTPYSFDPVERAVVARVKHDVRQVRRLCPQALAVLEFPAAKLKEHDEECRGHEARINAAAQAAGIPVERIMTLASAELDEERREQSNRLRRANRDFMRAAA